MDAGHRLIQDGAVAIPGDTIRAVGKRSELDATIPSATQVSTLAAL